LFSFNRSQKSAKKASDIILLQSYAKLYYREIVDLLASVPSDLLLLLKTNDCLRHLDKILDTPVNSTAGKRKTVCIVLLEYFAFNFEISVAFILCSGRQNCFRCYFRRRSSSGLSRLAVRWFPVLGENAGVSGFPLVECDDSNFPLVQFLLLWEPVENHVLFMLYLSNRKEN
jgi:hypothetical protein